MSDDSEEEGAATVEVVAVAVAPDPITAQVASIQLTRCTGTACMISAALLDTGMPTRRSIAGAPMLIERIQRVTPKTLSA